MTSVCFLHKISRLKSWLSARSCWNVGILPHHYTTSQPGRP